MSDFALPIPICMLGARGVGKTSMIAAMVHEFDKVVNDATLQLFPTAESARRLNQLLVELKAQASGADAYFDPEITRKPTIREEEHHLTLSHTSSQAEMRVSFVDYPGGWLVDRVAYVDEKLSEASIILVAVDAPSLMEHDDGEHEKQNRPTDIAQALSRGFKLRPHQQRLVLFVIMRGEKWMQGPVLEKREMRRRFGDRFSSSLRALKGHESCTAVVYCPIQTLGAAQYSHFKGGNPVFYRAIAAYDPQQCDQPLRYSLAFMIQLMQQFAKHAERSALTTYNDRHFLEKWWDGIAGFFGQKSTKLEQFERWQARSQAMVSAIDKYAQQCATDFPFEIIQNKIMLGL